ncbi:MAG: ATP-binding protein [Bryobacter sp.]|nr:ATP-binding protein [Bryobacter sp.]
MGALSQSETIEQNLASTLESVDQAESLVLEMARRIGFNEDDENAISMAVRESMVNAVAHGNKYNGRKQVHLVVEGHPGKLVVTVADEGDGFDESTVADPLAEENLLKQSGRGLLLMRAFMDECTHAKREPRGTVVRMVKLLPAEAQPESIS